MLVVLFFHDLGYSPIQIAMLFVFYELFGVITNLVGGWLGARWGLNRTMNIGLALQIIALAMLAIPSASLTVLWVMMAQALSGIAKDLNKMSAKSAIKLLVPDDASDTLFKWIAILTGSKNTLKGIGFFIGGGLLVLVGFQNAVLIMLAALLVVWLISLILLQADLGRSKNKPRMKSILSKSSEINRLSAARLFLFASRDVWFVVALPVYFSNQFGWSHWAVGGFMAVWIIGYGIVQTQAPRVSHGDNAGSMALLWVLLLTMVTTVIAIGSGIGTMSPVMLVSGLLVFGAVFAVNSSLHSFLIVNYSNREAVSLDVGFYYMANAKGRLIGTVLSGMLFQKYGLEACLWTSACFQLIASLLSISLPNRINKTAQ